ncbi:MAG TPA: deoxyribonuclease IV [Anaeromyxobacteraceae bacterium]|nr:deoxyribonuclease IV [Anaeromyxobacteraceae bacterium]
MVLGAHEGIGGGVSKAFERAEEDTADAVQIFVRNPRGWASPPLADDEVERFRAEARRTGKPTAAHSLYLANHAAADRVLREKSWKALSDELARCEELGIPFLVFHPGSNPDEAAGLALVAEGMERALDEVKGKARLAIEITAGQGSSLGWRFEHVAAIRDALPAGARRRAAVCFDTCHAFAAGYDLRGAEGFEGVFKEFDRVVGLSHLKLFHLNDCKKPLGCRVDRHEHIGKGEMGLDPFRRLVNDERFSDVPGFLETEMLFKENLRVLRSLARS